MLKAKNLGKDTVKMLVNKKGQALVEFVILLPIIMMIIFIIIDFANVFYQKNHLESVSNDVLKIVENNNNEQIDDIEEKENIKISLSNESNMTIIEISKEVNLVTPFSNLFFDNPFVIKTERATIYE